MTDWDRSEGRPEPRSTPLGVFAQLVGGVTLVMAMHLTVGLVLLLAVWFTASFEALFRGPLVAVPALVAWGAIAWLALVGLFQGAYVLPAFAIAWIFRRPVALGVAVGAALTLLLNGACFGWLAV